MKQLALVCFTLLLATACRKTENRSSWDVDALFPIATATLDYKDIPANTLIQTSADQQLSLVFEDNIYSLALDSLFDVPDTTISSSFFLPIGSITLQPGQLILNDTVNNTYSLGGVELKRATIRSGTVSIELSSSIDEAAVLEYQLPGATKNGIPLSVTATVPANGSISESYDLSGYTLDLTGIEGNRVNTVVTIFRASIDPAGQQVLVTGGDELAVTNNWIGIEPEFGLGYFSSQTTSISGDTATTNAFTNLKSGTFNIDDFSAELTIVNHIGTDIELTLNALESINSSSSSTAELQAPFLGQPLRIDRAVNQASGSLPVTPTYHNLDLGASNTNIDELLEVIPDAFTYNISAALNPLGNVSGSNDFLYVDHGIDLRLRASAPLALAANQLVLLDTVALDPGARAENSPADGINSGFLYLYADNGFPLQASLQAYLLDENMAVLDTLVGTENTIDAAEQLAVPGNTSPASSRIEFPVDQATIDHVYAARWVAIEATFTTPNNPTPVQLYSSYTLNLKLIADLNYNLDTNQ